MRGETGLSCCRLDGSGSLLVTRAGVQGGPVPFTHHSVGMKQNSLTLTFPNVRLTSVTLSDDVWVVWAESIGTAAACPRCQIASSARHSSYQRRFWDLPIQGRPVRITITVGRWQCRNADCRQSIFTERLPGMVDPRARQTRRAARILRPLGHGCSATIWVMTTLIVGAHTAPEAGRAKDWPCGWALVSGSWKARA